MKEYGIDLKSKHNKLLTDLSKLFAKVKKRRAFLIKTASPDVLRNSGRDISFAMETDPIEVYLEDIIAIEKAYTDQSKQLDMFDNSNS